MTPNLSRHYEVRDGVVALYEVESLMVRSDRRINQLLWEIVHHAGMEWDEIYIGEAPMEDEAYWWVVPKHPGKKNLEEGRIPGGV